MVKAVADVLSMSLDVQPVPDERREGTDFFGNRVTWIALDQPHQDLVITTCARVFVAEPALPDAASTPAYEDIVSSALAWNNAGPASPVHFLFPGRMVPLVPSIVDYAALSFPAGRPILAGALELTSRIMTDFAYRPGATSIETPIVEAFHQRQGVCQDFAHILIAGLRGLGLPALYVSGYLRTIPPPGGTRLKGADAMHAWVRVWCGEAAGWIGLDPTNGITESADHIPLATGRDYADIAPVDGVVIAAGAQSVHVSVDVCPVDEVNET